MQHRVVWGVALAFASACRPELADRPVPGDLQPSAFTADLDPSLPPPLTPDDGAAWVQAHYVKEEVRIPMRDGATLFTAIYRPRDPDREVPILLTRTPYRASPYGPDAHRDALGPSRTLMERGYVFVYQDVRGCFQSEGEFVNMRPHRPTKRGPEIDESSDTYDTIEWLVHHVAGHNGRVGMWGISYPGFYAAAGMIDAHPALVAVSPQAPIADWYFDDFHHHGAFFLPHAFNFFSGFGRPRKGLVSEWGPRFDHGTPDGYAWFLGLGALRNANEHHLHHEIPFWDELAAHPDYDEFWRERNLLPHLRNVAPAVMTVGGWFDAEDLYGPLQIYRAIEAQDPDAFNVLVMGPWSHGGWARTAGDHLGNADFEGEHSAWYQQHVEAVFFQHYLEGDGSTPPSLPEATVFETGRNRWRSFDAWPPAGRPRTLWLGSGHRLLGEAPAERRAFDEFVSDPARPVPYTEEVAIGMTKEYMTDDQRFAARRPDVLTWVGNPLTEPLTLAGPLTADLWVSTSEADADWVVKVIDVFPEDAPDHPHLARGKHMGGYQMMVRSEVIRGRYRDGYDAPKPFAAGKPTRVRLPLQDVLHTWEPGHRVMIQIQSTWFPLVDRNPQRWVDNVFEARDEDFVKATHRVWRDTEHASRLEAVVIPTPIEH
ncbi:CocE/NonD family hydrolase [Paraliomyxa miuraensis]|uniref:CocE/NonD family hydrolase n=1 Tax=Paraliomyxa miuraensis TaxID=376150 RepID=UPI00225865DB|nr:CocE/NonD family hydrolase [Paraliomyxa miuraensis]MCX4244894.1 CocE/NonD family hydrolase [Paraliomyxa miuraensis]